MYETKSYKRAICEQYVEQSVNEQHSIVVMIILSSLRYFFYKTKIVVWNLQIKYWNISYVSKNVSQNLTEQYVTLLSVKVELSNTRGFSVGFSRIFAPAVQWIVGVVSRCTRVIA